MHLTYLARREPGRPALDEFNKYELEALIVLREPKNIRLGDAVTLAQAVRWLADLGGYMNPHQGPPGPTVVGRGLDYVLPAARALAHRHTTRYMLRALPPRGPLRDLPPR